MSSKPIKIETDIFSPISENLALYSCRAKYVPDYINGGYRLSNICSLSRPVFNPNHLELNEHRDDTEALFEYQVDEIKDSFSTESDIQRSIRRARRNCFDYILCNDFDCFCTLTFNKEYVDRTSYAECYEKLRNWLSNRVTRRNLVYVCCPEYHHDGESIHFHLLCNSSALSLVDSGHLKKGKIIYNIDDWKWGFSTAMDISGENAQDKVAKYIMKYMTKNQQQKVGGRFYLSGGKLERPRYVYSNNPNDFADLSTASYTRFCELDFCTYEEWSFI